ncbi:MAG: 4-hydroxy-tetrahydrodipicolinate reductase [Candidatus Omnitrophica bacterium]|nr:4-hydroxy-tetrahydrodipicolinate reductase [Candidatus Omnitrophota bacterium]
MIRLVVAGAAGRMGKMILALASCQEAFKIVGGLEYSAHPSLGKDLGEILGGHVLGAVLSDKPKDLLKGADVLVDFSLPEATCANVQAAVETETACVIGTTGLGEVQMKAIQEAARKIPIVQSPNMSIGVNILFKMAEVISKALDESYDIELSEIHHRMKKDAPSGTALKLVEILAKARKKNLDTDVIFGRKGDAGARAKGKIGVFALRGGDVVGDHTLHFLGDSERLELTHRATSREAFAQGALRAAQFVSKAGCGLYSMLQVLGVE